MNHAVRSREDVRVVYYVHALVTNSVLLFKPHALTIIHPGSYALDLGC